MSASNWTFDWNLFVLINQLSFRQLNQLQFFTGKSHDLIVKRKYLLSLKYFAKSVGCWRKWNLQNSNGRSIVSVSVETILMTGMFLIKFLQDKHRFWKIDWEFFMLILQGCRLFIESQRPSQDVEGRIQETQLKTLGWQFCMLRLRVHLHPGPPSPDYAPDDSVLELQCTSQPLIKMWLFIKRLHMKEKSP